MSSLKAAYINELYKLSKKKKIVVSAILSLVAVVIGAVIVFVANNFMGIRVTGTNEFSIIVLTTLNYTLIPLFTAFVCIDMFSGEFADGTIKLTLTRPASRLTVYLSKVLAIGTFILANLMFVMIVSSIASIVLNATMFNFGRVFIAYFTAFFPMFVLALMVMLISNITHGTTSTFMISILVYIVFNVLGIIFSNYQSLLFTSVFGWYNLFLGSFINFSKIFRLFMILLGSGMTFFGIGYYLFDKKDV